MTEIATLQTDLTALANPDETGATVADAKRLAERADHVFVHYHVGPEDWRTAPLMLETPAFLHALRYVDGAERMPCRLYEAHGQRRLQVG